MGRRTRIAEGVYEDRYGVSATVKLARMGQRERRFPPGTSIDFIQAWRARTRAELLEARDDAPEGAPRAEPGTFGRDVAAYETAVAHRIGGPADVCHARAWLPHFRTVPRARIRPTQVQAVVTAWEAAGVAAGTIRHRVRVLRAIYRLRDRSLARPPLRDVVVPKPAAPHPVSVPWATVRTVAASLKRTATRQQGGGVDSLKGHARLLVLATTGQRPTQVMRAEPPDVDLRRRLWFVRAAKGGTGVVIPLDADGVAAWRAFIAVDAWGSFDTSSFAKLLRRHGWPAGVRPYTLRHTLAIDMISGGADLSDVQAALGHRHIETTRQAYAPMQLARFRRALRLKRRARIA